MSYGHLRMYSEYSTLNFVILDEQENWCILVAGVMYTAAGTSMCTSMYIVYRQGH